MWDYASAFGIGDYQITIGGGAGDTYYPPGSVNGVPPYVGTPGTLPGVYVQPTANQNQQLLLLGLVLLAVVLLTRK